jgi:nitric oxide reductase NorD protein
MRGRTPRAPQPTQERIAVHGFSSNGRKELRYVRFKEFGARYDDEQRERLETVRPAWSPRFGAALRHAGECIAQEDRSLKFIILVTDGEPFDIDVFDSRYLIEDARHAVRTLAARGIRARCIGVESGEHTAIRKIFGPANAVTVVRSSRLKDTLSKMLEELAA